ncbi:MAG: hypothetical protein J1E43_09280 [Christensenellaceae bacterium]|nr:hypothetical protein [Christensenellaceae bacterium]
MKRLLFALLILALMPLTALAEEAPAVDLNGDWYIEPLYGSFFYPSQDAPEEAPEGLRELLALNAPAILPLCDGAALLCELPEGGMPVLALIRWEDPCWNYYYSVGVFAARFEDGRMIEPASGEAADYALEGSTLSLTFAGEELTGEIVPYGADAFELRYTDEEFVSYANFGVPSLLFVRRSLVD